MRVNLLPSTFFSFAFSLVGLPEVVYFPSSKIGAKSINVVDPRPPDFTRPWMLSDVVLIVEGQKFHVHRTTLAMWSPVFEKMFTSFIIPLPGKKAHEIKELLLIIYISICIWKSLESYDE